MHIAVDSGHSTAVSASPSCAHTGRCPQPLLRCAGKLMLHVLDTLGNLGEDEGEPGYAAEAWTMLRLLAQHPAYCQAAAAGTVLGG